MPSTTVTERTPLNCSACGGRCCNYFALQIDTPTTAEEFDNLRWYMAHKHVAIFIEGTSWYLQVNNSCLHLTTEGACAIYEKRPQICRDYGWDPTGKTECHGTDRPCDHDHFFETLEDLETYLIQKKKRWASMPRGSKR